MRPGAMTRVRRCHLSSVIVRVRGPGWRTARSATASVNYFNLLACLKNWA